MPTYTFKNKTTGEVFDKWMKISECSEFLESNPNFEKIPTQVYYGGVQDLPHKHIDDGFKEVLSKIKESAVVSKKNNTINKWL